MSKSINMTLSREIITDRKSSPNVVMTNNNEHRQKHERPLANTTNFPREYD